MKAIITLEVEVDAFDDDERKIIELLEESVLKNFPSVLDQDEECYAGINSVGIISTEVVR